MASDPTSAPTATERKTVRVGKYEVTRHVATGGMGQVFRALDTDTGREVALKILPKDMAEKPLMLERFKRETRSAAKLDHENIVKLLEAGEVQGTFFFAMEFVEGVDFYDHIKRHGPLDPEEARLIVVQGAQALRHANEKNIVHRDIKPSNFLLRWEGGQPRVKLLDFGLARDVGDDEFRVTRAGTTVGTIDYMSPEQARDSWSADVRSDMYSLGATWYHLLCGQSPFPGGGVCERLLRLMQDDPPDLRDLNPTVSDQTWAVISRLLAKLPDERYQTPDELLEALAALEGHAVADPKARPARRITVRPEPAGDAPSRQLWYTLACAALFLLIGGAVVVLNMPRRPPPEDDILPQPALPVPTPNLTASPRFPPLPTPEPKRDLSPEPKPLRRLPKAADAREVRGEAERPWNGTAPTDPLTVRVGRAVAPSAAGFRSLGEACRAGVEGQPLVVEIHDNGPLFSPSLGDVPGRDLTLRAGPGYRPLIVWELSGKPDALTFLRFRGRLSVEGVELAFRLPDALPGPATVFDGEGELSLTGCTVSVAGKPRAGCVLLRLAGGRGRLARCLVRGASVTALSLDGGTEALVEDCLVGGGLQPLVRASGGKLRVVRSTLLGGPLLAEASSLSVFACDSLFSGGGSLISPGTRWRAANCVYAGWKRLPAEAPAEARVAELWPEVSYNEPATLPATTYQPVGPVLFASVTDPAKPLGCDVAALPACRDGWVSLALEPTVSAPELPSDDAAPAIPPNDGGLYHGETLDATAGDIGEMLARRHAAKRLAPRVVLHLRGAGELVTSPIRLKGVSLVLHLDRALALTLGRTSSPAPLIDLDGGSLEVIGGALRVPDLSTSKASHVVRVRGGDVRLFRTRIEGPKYEVPEGYVAAVSVAGSGDPASEKGRSLSANECVLLSSRVGVVLDGVGCRAALRQCVVVAGGDGLMLLPGAACRGHVGMGATLTNVTFACRRSVLHLGDAPSAGVPTEPAVVRARDCAYLNPFPGKPSKAGLLTWSGDALSRGLLVWHGQGEGFDRRLHFAAAPSLNDVGDFKEGYTPWKRLWGAAGMAEPRELSPFRSFDARQWRLEFLGLRSPWRVGANLDRLGIARWAAR